MDQLRDQDLKHRKVVCGVREYEIDRDFTFSLEFARKFIEQNFQDKPRLPFKYNSQVLMPNSIISTIRTKAQTRGNCEFKSNNILACYICHEKTGNGYQENYR